MTTKKISNDEKLDRLLVADDKSSKRDYIMIFLLIIGIIIALSSLVVLFFSVYRPDKQLTVTFTNLPWNKQIDGLSE